MSQTSSKPLCVLDCEVYRNYFLAKFRRLDTGAQRVFEQYEGQRLDRAGLRETLARVTSITFNGRNYDFPILGFALTGASCEDIKRCSDLIIQAQTRPWDVERQFGFKIPETDHIDLIEVVPGMVSLKVYMGRLHCRKMQDLPIEHDAHITPEQRPVIVTYNDNDLDGTAALYAKFSKQIELRREMSRQYGVDLRSKSDAQIAEAVIKAKLQEIGIEVRKPEVRARSFKFRFPGFLRYAGPIVQEVIQRVREADFVVDAGGYVKMPEQLAKAAIKIGQGVYRMGIGGLHSSEQRQAVTADDQTLIVDRDVASYYPAIIINTGLYPRHLGRDFLTVYRGIRDQRIAAKRSGDKTTAETLKIVLNGSFGKFGNPWSILYSPDLLIQTTVTGQLALLMLIEWIERDGIQVVSANTDGIVIKCLKDQYAFLQQTLDAWEKSTNFETEETRYAGIYSRDVNSYIALKEGGGIKLKGAYAEPEPVASSWPSPHMQVCVTAVCDYIEHGMPLELTIRACNDIRQFIEVRNVTGGATWRGEYLGRAVRWYYSTDGEPIYYRKQNKTGGHNKVAATDGCRPLMLMDGSIPNDLDYSRYVVEAQNILKDVGLG
jgi:DNA polymerase elongation subunit (family B)